MGGAAALLVGAWAMSAKAEGGNGDVSALACAAAYQLDWQATTSSERSAADREGAEKTFEALRAGGTQDAGAAVAQQTATLKAQVGASSAGLTEIVEACDRAWNGDASDYASQYAPPPAPLPASNAGITTFENPETGYSAPSPAPGNSADCETTDRRATGIMNTWTYALEDYFAGGVRDYDQERDLSDLYRRLRSRLQDELSTAETYGCDSLASDIRYGLSDWDNPF
ncbi:MAG: hypothetical protein KJ833_09460 [Alphaproteobacteria bacterium]|nr:hypothetical protein [Alphaproteobacteria bacterium]